MQTYARQGGTSTIFINDDGMQLLSPGERDARIAYYADHGIGWVARPKHDPAAGGCKRAGRFKKASNMNYALRLSLKLEKHLAALVEQEKEKEREREKEAAARMHDISYSQLMHGLKKAGVDINRKMLADLAVHDEKAFAELVNKAKSAL